MKEETISLRVHDIIVNKYRDEIDHLRAEIERLDELLAHQPFPAWAVPRQAN